MGAHMFPILNPPLSPPHPIPQGHPSAPALSTLSYSSNLDWRSISHMIIYMFQCYPLKSPHHCLLPLHFILSNNDQAVLGGSDSKESSCNAGHSSSIPGSEWSPGGGYRKPLQYSCWEITRTVDPGGLQSLGSQRVRHNWATNTFPFLSHFDELFIKMQHLKYR